MKKNQFRKWIAIFLMICLVLPIFCVRTAKPVRAGESFPNCGDNLSCWVVGSGYDNTLHIDVIDRSQTNNPISNFYYESGGYDAFPWKDYREFITKIVIDPGVTSIPEGAFADMESLEEICIPSSMRYIYEDAFKGTPRLQTVQYGGTEAEWEEFSQDCIYNSRGGNNAVINHYGRNPFCYETVTLRLPRVIDYIDLLDEYGVNHMTAITRTLSTAAQKDHTILNTPEGYDLDKDGTTDVDFDYPSGNGGNVEPITVSKSSECSIDGIWMVSLSDAALYELEKTYSTRFTRHVIFDLSPAPPVKSIKVTPAEFEIPAEGHSGIHVQVLPKEAEQDYTISVANTGIAAYVSVDGIIVGKQMGRTKVTVSTPDKKIKTVCNIHVLFKDVVNKNLAAYDAVYWGADEGIVKGYKTYFDIDGKVTRGQVVLFLWRAAGKPAPKSTELKFTDAADIKALAADYAKAIAWGSENGIVMGYTSGANAGKFKPNNPCTRGEIVTFLWRFGGKKPAKNGAKTFPDVPKSHKHYNAIMWASSYGITTGFSDGKFKPDQTCTRGQCVTFIYRMLK